MKRLSSIAASMLMAGTLLALGLWPGQAHGEGGEAFRFVVVNDTHYLSDECGAWLRTIFYLQAARDYIPAPKANYVRVVINGESWGVYVNAQQFNKEFVKEWFGTTEGAVKVNVHRRRRRYGDLLRANIEATVSDASEVDDEIAYLMTVVSR